jgi:peptide/nickel transport system substrate-binding protein
MRRIALLALAAFSIAACGGGGGTGGGATSTAPKSGGTLKVAQINDLNTLEPLTSRLVIEREVYYNLYDSLLTIDSKANLQPGLATKWDVSGDGKTITFTLRTGVKFHDGTDFNAEAVKFNIERYLKDGGALNQRRSELASVDGVDATNATTAVFRLKKPDATLLAALVDRAGMMLSPTAIKSGGSDFSTKPLNAGSGPFMFVEFKQGDHVTIKKNPNYWKKPPYLDQVIYYYKSDLNATLASLKTGDIDYVYQLDWKDVADVKANPDLVYKEVPSFAFAGFELNHAKPPFNDPNKRKAVALAIDRQQLMKNVFFNFGTISYGPISPSHTQFFDPTEKIYDRADPEKAKQSATGFSFTLKVDPSQVSIQAGQLIQAQLQKAGIEVKLQQQEFAQITNDTRAGNFEAALAGWSGRLDPDGNMYAWFRTGGTNNDGKYSNSQVDGFLDDARTNSDVAKRRSSYQQAQKILVQEVAYVFYRHAPATQISTKHVKGFTLYPDNINRFGEVWKDNA